jgi:predicted nucleotidyltransferase
VIQKLGNVEAVYLVGELARGLDNPIIDLVIVGEIDKNYLLKLTERAEQLIQKKVRFVSFTKNEFESQKEVILQEPHLEILN